MEISDLVYLDDTGYHYADYPTFLTFIQDAYKAIYGADVYLAPDSQDGQFLAVLAKGFYDVATLGASVYNSFSPVTAQGVGLSRNVKINGISRKVPTNSIVVLTIIGQEDTVISNGIAQDVLNQKWLLPDVVTIPFGGTIDVTATAEFAGNINAQPNTVTTIFTPTLGWQSVDNDDAAVAGNPVESDAELRIRQAQSTALPSLTVFDGTMGSVLNLEGVTSARGYENDTDSTDGNGIPSHSIEVVVQGGDTTEIAQAIQVHKTPGTGTAGSVSTTVYDAHGMPLIIKFERPTEVTIKVEIEIDTFVDYDTSYTAMIKQALVDYINGIGIGEDALYTKFFPVAYLPGIPGTTYDITDLQIGKNLDPVGTSNIAIAFDEVAVATLSDITVTFS